MAASIYTRNAVPSVGYSPLIVLGLFIEAACLEIVRIGNLQGLATVTLGGRPVTILVSWLPFFAAFVPYLIAVAWTHARVQAPKKNASPRTGLRPRGLLLVILGFAVAFRVTLLFSPPALSGDIFRYVWDGKMQNHGINPYRYPPDSPEIAAFRDEYYPGINNKSISTIYPPLMQMAFRITDRIAHTPTAMKVFFVLCDLAIIAVVLLLLRAHTLPLPFIIVYAWNPLVLVEVAGSGHNDAFALVLMLAAILAIEKRHPTLSVVWLALSFAAKFFSMVLIPAFFKTIRRVAPFLLFPAIVIALYIPFLDAGYASLFHGLFVYGDKWRFNDSLFTLFLAATGSLTRAKILTGILFTIIVLAQWIGDPPHIRTAYVLVGAYLLLTPTLQPWYLVWIVPFLCFYPNRAWIMLTGLVVLSYNVLIQSTETGIWKEAVWVRYVQFVPFYALLAYDGAKKMMQGSRFRIQD